MTTIVTKTSRFLLIGATASFLMLSLFGCASKKDVLPESMMMSQSIVMNRSIWRKMSEAEKKTYVRKSLEDVGENPDAFVSKEKTRESLLLEGLEAVYNK